VLIATFEIARKHAWLGTGWLVATVARRTPVLPVFTFALSVSTTILIALLLDRDQGDTLDLRMWLTMPLFLLVAPAAAIVIGGLAAVRNAAGRNGFPPRSGVPS
jgi:hypothetical protein